MTFNGRLAALLPGERKHQLALAAMILLYAGLMTRAQFMKYDSFMMGFDLGFYEQVVWNTSQGRWFATSALQHSRTTLGHDVCLLEAMIALPYALCPTAYTLLLLETAAVGLSVLPLYWLARDKLGAGAALATSFAYLMYAPLHFLNLYEFQPRAFALGGLFAMFYFLESESLRGFLVSALLILTTRSDLALLVAMFGLYALLQRKPCAFVLSAFALGGGWFTLVVTVIVPHFNTLGRFQYASRYEHWGGTPLAVAATVLTQPRLVLESVLTPQKLAFLGQIFGPLALLPTLRPDVLLLGAPTLVVNMLSSSPAQADIRYQYGAALYGLAFIGTVMSIASLARFGPLVRRLKPAAIVRALVALVVLGNVAHHVLLGSPLWKWLGRDQPPRFAAAAHRLIEKIPAEAPLAVTSMLGPHAARRRGLYVFPPDEAGRRDENYYSDRGLSDADYVLVDLERDSRDPAFGSLTSDPRWERLAKDGRFLLFRRRDR